MKLLKEQIFKILIIAMVTIGLSLFFMPLTSEAKLKIEEGEYYYTGVQEANLAVEDSLLSQLFKSLKSLGNIANYILGIITLGIRGVFVGWIEIMEILLTALLGVETDLGKFFADSLAGIDGYSQQIVNVEKIIFNRIGILNANIFQAIEIGEEVSKQDVVVEIIRNSVAKWYYIMRLISIAFMLILLIFIGIKMALSTVASEKAVYKSMIVDWFVGMVLVFSIHYIMVFILNINDTIVSSLEPLAKERTMSTMQEYEYGEETNVPTPSEIETSLYETVRTRAYSLKLTDGFTGMIIYGVLVYYAWRFALIYFRRLLNIMMLTLTAPVISASYALNKVMTGKSKIYSTWLSEYIMNVITQIVHVIVYAAFVSIALQLSTQSLVGTILAFVLLNFMTKTEKFLRQIFKITGGGKGSLAGDMNDRTGFKELKNEMLGYKSAMVGGTITANAMKATYGLALKPVKSVAINTLAETTARKLNSEKYKEKKAQKEQDELNEEIADAQEYMDSTEEGQKILALKAQQEAIRAKYHPKLTQRQIDAMRARGITTEHERYEDYLKLYGVTEAEINAEKATKQREIDNLQRQIEDLQKELGKKEYLQDFLTHQVRNKGTLRGTLALGLMEARLSLVEFDPNTGKYKKKKVKKLRKGGLDTAFWRKTEDSLEHRLLEKLTVGELLGINSSEQKVLKDKIKFWKNRVVGLGSSIAGAPMVVINPIVGMAMLTTGLNATAETAKRRRRFKNACYNEKHRSYKYYGFAPGTVHKLSAAQSYHLKDIQKLEVLKHKKVKKEVKRVMNYVKYREQREKGIQSEITRLTGDYNALLARYESELMAKADAESQENLLFEDKKNQMGIVPVGNKVCMQLEVNTNMNKLLEKIRSVNMSSRLTKVQKNKEIQKLLATNKEMIIRDAIVNVCTQENITDIANLEMTDFDMLQINSNILRRIESAGVVTSDKLNLESIDIGETAISTTYLNMTRDYSDTNKILQDNLVANTILEYMEQEKIEQVSKLKSDTVKGKIEETLKNKMMSDSSKQTASVIERLTGKKTTAEYKLPQEIIDSLDEQVKNVKKISIGSEVTRFTKKELKNREVNRRMNETKKKIEEILYRETIAEVTYTSSDPTLTSGLTGTELEIVQVLRDLKEQNDLANQHKIEIGNNGMNQQEKLKKMFHPNPTDPEGTGEEKYMDSGDVIKALHKGYTVNKNLWTPNTVGSRSLAVGQTGKENDRKQRRELRAINAKIHGPGVDIGSLINSIGR